MTEAESLKTVLCSIFRRRGGETSKTMVFENLPAQIQSGLLGSAMLAPDELPVVASVENGNQWVLITTQRVLVHRSGETTTVDCSQLRDATVALGLDAARGATNKTSLTSLKLVMKSGEERIVQVEPGVAHMGIWNVLKHFAAKNAKT